MNLKTGVVGAVDIGGTKIAVGLVRADGRILAQTDCPSAPEGGVEEGLDRIQTMFLHCQEQVGLNEPLLGIGIGCTGPVDPDSGVLGPNSFLPGWEGVSLMERVESRFGLPAAIENDADAAALGEFAWGAGQGAARFIYVTISTGIGGGMVFNGHLYRGVNGAHPEIGHHVVEAAAGGPRCFCGARGCWESLASGPALAGWYQAQRAVQAAEEIDPGSVDARDICRRAAANEPLAREAVEREGYYLGIGLANLVNLYTPDVIALGGGVMQSWPLFEARVREIIRQHCGLVPHELTQLRLAGLGARTGLAGAARVWFHKYMYS